MITITKRFTKQDVATLKEALQEKQGETPPKTLTAKQVILQLKPELEYLHSKGWTWTDITLILARQGLTISSATLSDYLKNKPDSQANPMPLSLEALDELYRSTSKAEVSKTLNKRNKVSLSRFFKSLQTGLSEIMINKMNKADLIAAIIVQLQPQARDVQDLIQGNPEQPRKVKSKTRGEHDDLFNIDLGI